ncbi:MAG: hypothetical protein O3B01_04265 [Planctomycetota bacterium]|nr:hypothetical protein [Planctomycetota bacterium]
MSWPHWGLMCGRVHALQALMPCQLDHETGELARTGNVAYELLKPVDLYFFWS